MRELQGDFKLKICQVGHIHTNCYILYRETEKKAVIVDPGADGAEILSLCGKLSLTPEAILLTHGHFDHILAVKEIQKEFPRIKLYAGEDERETLQNPGVNYSTVVGAALSLQADQWVTDGEHLSIGDMKFTVIFTPGHTSGSVCYLVEGEDVLISGDTLFLESYGRTDMPGGSYDLIVKSITKKLFLLPEHTLVYPGHGDFTTIGYEKRNNPVAFNRE